MPGVINNPFGMNKGFMSATSFSVQFGSSRYPVKGVIRCGFPKYHEDIQSPHTIDYSIRGAYVEPGVMIYSGDPDQKDPVYYVGLMAYFSQYRHDLKMEINDPNWGTQSFEYTSGTNPAGALFEFGMMFTFFEHLKGNVSLNIGGVKRPDNPISQIRNFKNTSDYIPGIGHGNSALLGFNIGVHYVIR
jgi:hypothetical protein